MRQIGKENWRDRMEDGGEKWGKKGEEDIVEGLGGMEIVILSFRTTFVPRGWGNSQGGELNG
jgi:hypothetical protein